MTTTKPFAFSSTTIWGKESRSGHSSSARRPGSGGAGKKRKRKEEEDEN
jgi:hypothetical protein